MKCKHWLSVLTLACAVGAAFAAGRADYVKELRIDYINVGQGGSTFITGPNGVKILYDFGRVPGARHIVPYLKERLNLKPGDGIDYAILSHADKDHYMGYRDVVDPAKGGFNILKANFEPGAAKQKESPTLEDFLLEPAENFTTVKAFRQIPLGYEIDLGNGALAIAVARNGQVLGDESSTRPPSGAEPRLNENDRSISLFIKYKKFHYIIDGDLGSGAEKCSEHQTGQRDIQTKVAQKLIDLGLIDPRYGVDVLHIAHHGSEASTSWKYYQLMKPEVGVISVGPDQGNFQHPRINVVERVLTCKTGDGKFAKDACDEKHGGDTRAACYPAAERAPALQGLYQTDIGYQGDANDQNSANPKATDLGFAAGDIIIRTDGETNYAVSWTGKKIPWENTPVSKQAPITPGEEIYRFDEDMQK